MAEFIPTAGTETPVVQPAAPAGQPVQPVTVPSTGAVPADLLAQIMSGQIAQRQPRQEPVQPAPQPVQPQGAFGMPVIDSGDALVDQHVRFFAQANKVDAALFDQAIKPALVSGNAADLDVLAISAKLGTDAARAAQQMFQTVQGHVADRAGRTTQLIHQEAGGAENWKAAVQYFNQVTPDSVKGLVRQALESGAPESVRYGVQQVLQAARSAGIGANPVVPFGSTSAGSNTGLTKAEFQAALTALQKEAGNRSLESGAFGQKYEQLVQQRRLGKSLGKN